MSRNNSLDNEITLQKVETEYTEDTKYIEPVELRRNSPGYIKCTKYDKEDGNAIASKQLQCSGFVNSVGVEGADKLKYATCKFCNIYMGTINKLDRHVIKVHNIKRHKCDKCEFQAGWKSGLDRHKVQIHHESALYLRCTECTFSTFKKGAFKKGLMTQHKETFHGKRHKKAMTRKCNQCTFSSTNKLLFKKHMKKVHYKGEK